MKPTKKLERALTHLHAVMVGAEQAGQRYDADLRVDSRTRAQVCYARALARADALMRVWDAMGNTVKADEYATARERYSGLVNRWPERSLIKDLSPDTFASGVHEGPSLNRTAPR